VNQEELEQIKAAKVKLDEIWKEFLTYSQNRVAFKIGELDAMLEILIEDLRS